MTEKLPINFGREPQCDGCASVLDDLQDEMAHSGISCAEVETTPTYGEVLSYPPLIPDGRGSFKCLGYELKEALAKQSPSSPELGLEVA